MSFHRDDPTADEILTKLKELSELTFRLNTAHSRIDYRPEFMRRAFHALNFNGITGDYVEFGSHGARTFSRAFSENQGGSIKRKLWAFDSFSGLPEQEYEEDYHPKWERGAMATSVDSFLKVCRDCGMQESDFNVVEGYYEDTLPGKTLDDPTRPRDIALAYIDCDLYSSTMTVLDFLKPRLKHGMIIAFDDYFCYSDRTLSGERKAMLDTFTPELPFDLLPYFQFGWHGMSFILEDKAIKGNAK